MGQSQPTPKIQFGTDGWRGLIAQDYTMDNVRLVARAVARYVLSQANPERGVLVGYDCRFMSANFAQAAAEEVAASGIPVRLAESYTPTPAVSYAVRNRKAAGAIVITASHNPWQWNGLKFKASYGGSAGPEIIKKIEAELPAAVGDGKRASATAQIPKDNFSAEYFEHIAKVIDIAAIQKRKFSFVNDPMFGAARKLLADYLVRHGIRCEEIHGDADPMFGGLNPEPIDPHISALRRAVVDLKCDAGFAQDGDADRIGAVDRDGQFIDSHKIFSILLRYLVEVRGMKGGVAKTFSTTKLIDKLANKYGLPLYESPIGFKYICDFMLSKDILIGGEESGGIGIPALGGPERDGILNSLLLAEAMAHYGKSMGELVADFDKEFGPHQYGRIDLDLKAGQKEKAIESVSRADLGKFAGFEITKKENLDGIKMYFANGAWLLLRPSGTEPLLRIYSEAPTKQLVSDLLSHTEAFVRNL